MALVSSCSLLSVKQEVKDLSAHGLITVQVTPIVESAPMYALAWTKTASGTNEMIGFQPVGEHGLALFLLRQNRTYNLGAFTDLNRNGAYDEGEPVAYVKNLRPTSLADDSPRSKPVPLHLSPTNGLPPGQSATLPRENPDLGDALPVVLGEIANLDDPKFSAEVGEMGMWKPYNFILRYGFGIYFLELLQSPQTASAVHQWYFRFTPGLAARDGKARSEKISGLVCLLSKRHPAGQDGQRTGDRAAALETAAWLRPDGHRGAQHGRPGIARSDSAGRGKGGYEFHPGVFHSLDPVGGTGIGDTGGRASGLSRTVLAGHAPDSAYLREIISHPLPPGTRHDLMFSYQSSGGLGLPADNDGVVGVASELSLPVQEQAATVFGLHLDRHGDSQIPHYFAPN